MAVRDLIPWGRNRSSVPSATRGEEVNPFLTLHREMNRLFDDVFSRFDTGLPTLLGRAPTWTSGWPSIEVNASDKGVRISAELPDMNEKDIEVLVDENVLTIRGEKKSEAEDRDRHFTERYYGRFERSIALPFEVEDDKAEASFRNGVLTITLPKSPKAQERGKRIVIDAANDTKH
jgi:HSP20 family protein